MKSAAAPLAFTLAVTLVVGLVCFPLWGTALALAVAYATFQPPPKT
jgi:hypothetical protein